MIRFSFIISLFLTAGLASAGQVRDVPQSISFEPNQGQTSSGVKFLARAGNYRLFLTDRAAVLAPNDTQPASLSISLVRSNPTPRMTPLDEQRGISNYLTGSDPAQWVTDVKHYAKVRYEQVYPGVDLVYYGKENQLEHDFIVAPGADYRKIQVRFDGASAVRLTEDGGLVLQMPHGELRQHRPLIYQEAAGQRKVIAGGYRIDGREVSFHVDAYDPSRPLIIDPTFTYFATYLGGSGIDQPTSIAVDAQGNAYTTGATSSVDFPTKNPAQPHSGGMTDVFVTKLGSADGSVIYSTYLGGSNKDSANQIKVDASGNAYIAGTTLSNNFPTTAGAFQRSLRGPGDAFAAKLNPAGNALVYSTYLGGSGGEIGRGLDLDAQGNAYVVGMTFSTDFPQNQTQFGFTPLGGGSDGFVTEINPTGTALVYSGYIGGSATDCLTSVAVNSLGEATVVGFTNSTNLPTTFQGSRWPNLAGGLDSFMAKLSPGKDGFVSIEYISYFGGSNDDIATSIVADPRDDVTVYISGLTASPDLPTPTGVPVNANPNQVVPFVVKFGLPGLVFVASKPVVGEPAVARATEIDDFSWLRPTPDDCNGGDWGPLLKKLRDNMKDYDKFNTFMGDVGNLVQDVFAPILSVPKDIIIIIKSGSDFCTDSSKTSKLSPARPLSALLVPDAAPASPTPLFAVSADTGADATIPQLPIGNPASFTSVFAVAAGPTGNIYMAVQTDDTTLPVSAAGAKASASAQTGYVIELAGTAPPPTVSGVVNGASFTANAPVAPGSLISLFGTFTGTSTAGASSIPLPPSLGGASVTINGTPAPLNFVTTGQINAQVPWAIASGPATAIVTSGGIASAPFQFTVAAAYPGIFVFGTNRAVVQNQDFSLNTTGSPAAVGSFITVYMTGGGAVNPPIATGAASPGGSTLAQVTAPHSATIGGQPADVQFLGMAPGFVAVVQANVKVPALSAGDYPLVITIGGQKSNGPLVTVK